MTRKNVLTFTVVALAFGAIGLWLGLRNNPAPAPVAAPVAVAPGPVGALFSQSMNDASGANHSLARWKGKPLVVNFWAPWCGPCVQEMPELNQLAIASAAQNINVIGIGIDSPANIAEFASRLKISYPLYVAGMGGTELARQFGNSAGGLPYTVLIGADGQVVKTYLGKLKFEELKADLAKLKS
ncbi:MAG: TlpA disulfide reductase family protein [Pseudomonadota bacterium]